MPIEESRLNAHLDDPNRLSTLVKGHLWAERGLNQAIEIASVRPDQLKVDRLSFALKVDLAAALDAIDLPTAELLRKLNTVRNRAAHKLDFEVTDAEVDELSMAARVDYRERVLAREDRTERLSVLLHFVARLLEITNAGRAYAKNYGHLVGAYEMLYTTYTSLGEPPDDADRHAREVANPPPTPSMEDIIIPDPSQPPL